jgi:hypothetical protein
MSVVSVSPGRYPAARAFLIAGMILYRMIHNVNGAERIV